MLIYRMLSLRSADRATRKRRCARKGLSQRASQKDFYKAQILYTFKLKSGFANFPVFLSKLPMFLFFLIQVDNQMFTDLQPVV